MMTRIVNPPQRIEYTWPLIRRGEVVHHLLSMVRNTTVLRRPDDMMGTWVITLNDADNCGAENTHWGLSALHEGGLI
ncbi:MAG: hypothetical protein ACRDQX_06210, partial [Pseudonocardiaceae bacterium]